MKELIELKSVGCFYDPHTGYVYPIQRNFEPDLKMGVRVRECSPQWTEKLSSQDYKKIKPIDFLKF